jgi:hypothetical protein
MIAKAIFGTIFGHGLIKLKRSRYRPGLLAMANSAYRLRLAGLNQKNQAGLTPFQENHQIIG